MRRRRVALLGALLVLAAPLGWWAATLGIGSRQPTFVTNPADFRAFYCASRTLLQRHDPYRTEPLRTCEHAAAATYGLQMFDGLVLPAPLPPYALAYFAPLALLPFALANPVWLVLSLALFSTSALLLTRLTGFPLAGSLAALGGAVAYVSLPLGQIVPMALASLCLAAFALREQRYGLAALACGVSAIEPHIGFPACAALFYCCPRARAPLLWVAAGALVLSVCAAGFEICSEYVTTVLPLHALSQIDDLSLQYSLTSVVRAAGGSVRGALLAGAASYAVMAFAGIVVAKRLALRYTEPAYAVLIPPAFVVVGGPFVHLAQIGIAVPALVLLLCRMPAPSRLRPIALAALIALAIPWGSIADAPGIAAAAWPHATPPKRIIVPPAASATYAEVAETAFRHAGGYGSNGASAAREIAIKIPTWLALLALVGMATAGAFGRPSEAGARAA